MRCFAARASAARRCAPAALTTPLLASGFVGALAENEPKATVSAFGNLLEDDSWGMGASESRRMDLTALPGRFSIQFEFAPGEVGWERRPE